jgi:5'-nucleotidase
LETAHLTILHTNDIHGRPDAMARIGAFARGLRRQAEEAGRAVLLWDAGDPLDRRYRLCSLSKGAALARVLNAMGYDLMTMGNDILLTYGPEAMGELARRLACPVLAANCRDGDGPLAPGLQATSTMRLPDGPVLGVIGLTAPWGGLYECFGYRFPDFVELAAKLAARLRVDGAQAILVLSHLGLSDDLRLAEGVAGIDVIIGGHSHDVLLHGLETRGVLIAQAGQYGEALGCVELTFEKRTGKVVSKQARVEPVPADQAPDPAVIAAMGEAEAEVQDLAARPVGELLGDLSVEYQDECDLGNVAADALRERMQAETALIIAGQFRHGLSAGTLTFGELGEAIVTTANPQRTRVHGRQIVAALERSLDPALTESRPHPLRGTPVGRLQLSGLQVTYADERPIGQRVLQVLVGGQPLATEHTYLLAHTDAETSAQLQLLRLEDDQQTETEVPTVTREVVEAYIRQHSPLAAPQRGRWIRLAGQDEARRASLT